MPTVSTGLEANTIHRLLEVNPATVWFYSSELMEERKNGRSLIQGF